MEISISEDRIKIIEVKSEIAAGTRGASMGIDALKIASLDLESNFFTRFDGEEVETLNDMLFDGFEHSKAKFIDGVYTMQTRVCEKVSKTLSDGNFPLVLAGDHSTAAGTIMGIKNHYKDKKLGVIWIDAHADLHTPYTTPSGNMHGMPLAMVAGIDNLECRINEPKEATIDYWNKIKNIAFDGPKINLSDVVFISARDLEQPEIFLLDKYKIRNFTTDDVRAVGTKSIVEQALKLLDHCDILYVSFDVDSMDSLISVGTGTPVAHGLTAQEARELNVEFCKSKKIVAWEMVEVNPTLDTENKMAETALLILEAATNSLINKI